MSKKLQIGQRVIVKPNLLKKYFRYAHKLMCLGKIVFKNKIPYAKNCAYIENYEEKFITIPLELLWIVDDSEDLYIKYLKNINTKRST